jgi:hypothetical protein
MKKVALFLLILLQTWFVIGQNSENQKIIDLAKAYNNFMFMNNPPKEIVTKLEKMGNPNLEVATKFILECIKTNNKILTQPFLNRPEDKYLKQIYIIRSISLNLSEENGIDNNKLIDSLFLKEVPIYECLDNYYKMVVTSSGNKNKHFNLSKVNIKIDDYNFKDDTEKAILFFQVMSLCGTNIWGFMNIPKPANTKKAYEYIKKFPKINGMPYYQYKDFYFTDFEMIIVKDKGVQSYKNYYLDKYYETLMNHLKVLQQENRSEKEINELLLGSILKERNLYKYTKYKTILERTFKMVKEE